MISTTPGGWTHRRGRKVTRMRVLPEVRSEGQIGPSPRVAAHGRWKASPCLAVKDLARISNTHPADGQEARQSETSGRDGMH